MEDIIKLREKLLNDINQSEKKKKFCFVGAGLSAISKVPTWDKLIKKMYDCLKKYLGSDDSFVKEFELEMNNSNYTAAAQLFRDSSIDYETKHEFFMHELVENKEPSIVHQSLVKIPFHGILTTNFDHLIEDAYAAVFGKSLIPFFPNSWERIGFFEFPDEFFLAKLHGDANDWSNMVLDTNSYEQAKWIDKILKKVDDQVIFIFGVGGHDFLVNNFITRLSSNTKIHLFMLPESGLEFKKNVTSFVSIKFPKNVTLHDKLNKEEIQRLILGLGQSFECENLHDSFWGEMPISLFKLDFGNEGKKLRDFLHSNDHFAILNSTPGKGLSSLLAQALRERSKSRNALIFRLEGKEYLPLESYIYFIVKNLRPEAYKIYLQERQKALMGWDEKAQAMALAKIINSSDIPIIISIEQVDQVVNKKDTREFIKILLDETNENLKLIFSTTNEKWSPLKLSSNSDSIKHIRITLNELKRDCIEMLCEQRGISPGHVESILQIDMNADLATITLAATIMRHQICEIKDIEDLISKSDHFNLCKIIIDKLSTDKQTLEVLKYACLFRTTREIEKLQRCCGIKHYSDIKEIITQLVDHGLLIQYKKKYAMSSTIKDTTFKIVFNGTNNDVAGYLETIGDLYSFEVKKGISGLDDEINREMQEVIFNISSAFFYYKESKNRRKYLELLKLVYEHFLSTSHYNLLEQWINDIPRKEKYEDLVLEYEISSIKASLSVEHGICQELAKNIDECKRILTLIESNNIEYEQIAFEKRRINYYEGVLYAIKRQYNNALKKFESNVIPLNEIKDGFDLKTHLRIVQTLLSLGKIKKAEDYLCKIEEALGTSLKTLKKKEKIVAKINRHHATIEIIMMMRIVGDFLCYDDLNTHFGKAMSYAERCIEISRTIKDFCGEGEGLLKRAQAYFYKGDYLHAAADAIEAANKFASFPNSRWWRMTCHDLAAKSNAHLNQIEEAKIQLRIAQEIWKSSSKEDSLRQCELSFTEGVIKNKDGEFEVSRNYLMDSLKFQRDESPCIYKVHLKEIINSDSVLGKYDDLKKHIKEFQSIKIDI